MGVAAGQRVLELGCGSGVLLRLAAERGATVYGLDASEALVEIARSRVPDADVRVGDMQFLPYEDDLFDLVAGFNSFFFAADMVAALREAGRVAKRGAPVVIQVWGRPERCDLEAMKRAVTPFLPGALSGSRRPPPEFWKTGVLGGMATEAVLTAESTFDTCWAYEYAGEEALARGMLAAGGLAVWPRPPAGRWCGRRSSSRSPRIAPRAAATGSRTSGTTSSRRYEPSRTTERGERDSRGRCNPRENGALKETAPS